MTNIICKEIRQVPGGFIVEMRWPYGPEPCGHGEVICLTFEDVVILLKKGVVDE